MFSYAVKRITRGRGLFLSLFLSVALAATLFSGILQGADAIGVAILDETLKTAYVDIISSAPDKNARALGDRRAFQWRGGGGAC